MDKFTLEIDCAGVAFYTVSGSPVEEVARILRRAAELIETKGMHDFRLMDANGNTVGFASFKSEHEDNDE